MFRQQEKHIGRWLNAFSCSIAFYFIWFLHNLIQLYPVSIIRPAAFETISSLVLNMHSDLSFFFLNQWTDWMRIGAFLFDSQAGLLSESLISPLKIPDEESTEKMLQLKGCCLLKNIKTGIWIAGNSIIILFNRHFLLYNFKYNYQFIS